MQTTSLYFCSLPAGLCFSRDCSYRLDLLSKDTDSGTAWSGNVGKSTPTFCEILSFLRYIFSPRLVQAPCLNFSERSFGDKMQCSPGEGLLAAEVAKQEREAADLYSNSNMKVRPSEHLELPRSITSTKARHILTSLYCTCQRTYWRKQCQLIRHSDVN